VIARNTAFTYKGKPVDMKQIGRELGVRYVLEGSVRRVGEKVEVNSQLISTATGAHVWADRFDGERSKLGELQVDFVSRLANSLGVELVKAESLRAMRERPNNLDAADLAMRATALWNSSGESKLDDVVNLYERALALDPHNVPAMTGLAGVLQTRVTQLASKDPGADIARADELINAAVALQPDNSSAHGTKGWLFFAKRQWGQAIAEEETAIAEDRNNADAHAAASFFKMWLGHSENGFSGVETALRLSPRDPNVPTWQFFMCHLQPISPNGNRRSNGATSQPRATPKIFTRWSTSPPLTPGPVTTRKRKRPWPNCRKSIPASPCKPGRAFTGPTIRPSMRSTRASLKACAKPACRRAKRRRIEQPRPRPVRVG
jgi:adenylate cyclase